MTLVAEVLNPANSTEHCPSPAVICSLVCQNVPRILLESKRHYSGHTSPPLVYVLIYTNSDHFPTVFPEYSY